MTVAALRRRESPARRGGLPLVLALALREQRNGLRGFYVFIACVALGVGAITGVGALVGIYAGQTGMITGTTAYWLGSQGWEFMELGRLFQYTLLLSFALCLPVRGWLERGERRGAALLAGFFVLWNLLTATDMYLADEVRGTLPVASLDGRTRIMRSHSVRLTDPETGRQIIRVTRNRFDAFDDLVEEIRARTPEGRVWLDLSASPMLHVGSRTS